VSTFVSRARHRLTNTFAACVWPLLRLPCMAMAILENLPQRNGEKDDEGASPPGGSRTAIGPASRHNRPSRRPCSPSIGPEIIGEANARATRWSLEKPPVRKHGAGATNSPGPAGRPGIWNLFQYFTEIEEHFSAPQLTLAALDARLGAVIETGRNAESARKDILRGIGFQLSSTYCSTGRPRKRAKSNGPRLMLQEVLSAPRILIGRRIGLKEM